MKLKDLYKFVIETGRKSDPRPKREVNKVLFRNKNDFRALKGKKKALFDKDALFNPYNDTRILYGDGDRDIKTLMAGIDVDGTELLIADRFNRTGNSVDLVISHHPAGRALAELYKVMDLQTDRLKGLGITPEVAEEMMKERTGEVSRKLHSANCMRTIDIARILDIPYMCMHTAADNMVNNFLQGIMKKKNPKTVGGVIDLLFDIYEYREGSKCGIGPAILVGDRKKPSGKILVDMTGGTEGSKRVFGRLSQIGIGTLISMHLSEEHYKQAKKEHINVVIAGHMPSDSVGLNLMFDELIKKEALNIIPCSGFIRFSRI